MSSSYLPVIVGLRTFSWWLLPSVSSTPSCCSFITEQSFLIHPSRKLTCKPGRRICGKKWWRCLGRSSRDTSRARCRSDWRGPERGNPPCWRTSIPEQWEGWHTPSSSPYHLVHVSVPAEERQQPQSDGGEPHSDNDVLHQGPSNLIIKTSQNPLLGQCERYY